ncbi:MAG: hypothetical protein KBF73_01210 [Flavobacteriales bacterium]|nr:hypothetical protein [Flavobacteriales bacterium]
MSIEMLVLGTLLTAICIVPFGLMAIGRRKKREQLLQLIENLRQAEGNTFTNVEYCADILLATDEQKKYLFFAKITKDGVQTSKCVDLGQVTRCEGFKQSHVVKNENGSYPVIDRLELRFFGAKNDQQLIKLELYNADESFKVDSELELMNRWEETVNLVVGQSRKSASKEKAILQV